MRLRNRLTLSAMSITILAAVAASLPTRAGAAEVTPSQPTPQNLEARRWFAEARFGLFVHWGVYSVLSSGEWVLNTRHIPLADYERLPAQFNPKDFNAAEWVSMVKAAGMKYITITSKHHDGFAMFDSKVSNWDIVERTPYKKDPLKMLADECRKQGIKLFFYHSQLDWHHPDYFPRGETGGKLGRPEKGEWYKYLDYMDAQLTELLTNYGPIAGIWFDGMWDKPEADWRIAKTYDLIHRLQPQALVGSNHHRTPFPGEDFQMFEKDLPGQNAAGFSGKSSVSQLPLETCETINTSWGFNISDKNMKSTKDLLHYLVRAASLGANFLLNVGPMPNGKIQPEFVERLGQMGAWLKVNGESVYGTTRGPISKRPWGVTTRKGNTIYVHLFDWADSILALPSVGKIVRARALKGGGAVTVTEVDGGPVLKIPPSAVDPYDTVIALEVTE